MKSTRSRFALELLEARQMLTLAAAGVEFLVNAYTTGTQGIAGLDVAADADGDFVAVWDSTTGDGSSYAVFAQRFNASGVKQGTEFHPNTYTTNVQALPSVAMDADGDFVIAWMSTGQDGSSNGVFAQRYNAAGVTQGPEFRVNNTTTGSQTQPAVAMDAAGNFVIAWASVQTGDTSYGIYAQRYNFAGVAQGSEFHVNTYTANTQDVPAIAMDAAGDFVVAWRSAGGASLDTSGYGVYARRFNSSGTAQGSEFEVNNFTTGTQQFPSIAMDFTGNFVIAWESQNQDGASWGIYARRYDSAGVAQQASEFSVNTYTTSAQRSPVASADADGDFIISWTSTYQTGAAGVYDVYAKRYNSASIEQTQPTGTTPGLGSEFLVNTYTTDLQYQSSVAMDAKGDVIIAYKGNEPTDTGGGIYAQRYSESADTAPPIVAGVFVNGKQVRAYSVHSGPVSQLLVSFSEDVSQSGGTGGANSVTNPANWRVVQKIGATVTTIPISGITYGFNATTNRFEALLTLSGSFTAGNIQVVATDNIQDLAGNALDGNLDGVTGGGGSQTFAISFGPRGGEFPVNTYTTNTQATPAVGMNSSGDFVVTWASDQDGGTYGIYAQRYDAAGIAQGTEFKVNTYTTNIQRNPAVAVDSAGDFVIVWQSFGQDGGGYGVYAQRYNASGGALGSEFKVNTYTTSAQFAPAVGMDSVGDFVVTWQSAGKDGSGYGIYAQRYNSAGTAQGTEFKANTYTTGDQIAPSVAMNTPGDFVVTWTSFAQDGDSYGIYAQRYNAAGVAQGTEFRLNSYITGTQTAPAIAMDSVGDFVVSWQSDGQDGDGTGVYARRYDSTGAAQGTEIQVNTYTTSGQFAPAVAMNSVGDFVVTWISTGQDGSSSGIFAQRYDFLGSAQESEFKVNTYTTNVQFNPAVAMDSAGDFVIAWSSSGQDGSGFGIYGQRYGFATVPIVGGLADSPDPGSAGSPVTLTASGVSDDGTVASVAFYRESNGIAGLQFGPFGDTLVGTDTDGGDGWSVAASTTGLSSGTYTYYAVALDDENLTGAPASTTNTLTAPPGPVVASAEFLYDNAPQALRFTFDRDVSATFDLADISTIKIGGGAVPALNAPTFLGNVATLTFASTLADGNYRATISASGVTDNGNPMAADYILDFFILGGDANHDRKVDLYDLVAVAVNWQGTGKTFSQGDFDYNGIVNSADLGILAQHWQQTLALPAPPLPAAPTSAGRTAASRTPTRIAAQIL